MSPEQIKVRDFHIKYGCPVSSSITELSTDDRFRRARLIVSEASEFLESANKNDIIEMCDALADILYVVYGTAVELGVDLEPIFNNVHNSNMTKDGTKDKGGKILKGVNYKPPQIKDCLQQQGWNSKNG